MLSGTGGDELFGGYPWRYYRAVANDDFEHYVDEVLRLLAAPGAEPMRPAPILAPIWRRRQARDRPAISSATRSVDHADQLTRPEDYVNHSLYFEAKTFLHGLLVVEDKLSMAHGLETRVPFLDNDLVDFAMRMPVRQKLGESGRSRARRREHAGGEARTPISRRTQRRQAPAARR